MRASVTEEPQPIPPPQQAQRAEEPLVDRQIRRTRRAIKLVDLTAGLITLAIGILVFLLTMAVLEHWVIPGGWSDTARVALFGVLVLGIAGYSWRTFWPLLGQSINPVYAALAIEQSSPSLKNSLLNLLLLRNRKRHLSRQVYQAIEQQAAQRLSQVSLESVVDRSAILRLGYILVTITALCALYRFLSPKDLIASAGRVLLPWSSIVTPSRVQILNVTPGDAKAARGDRIRISAEVLGLDEDEPVRLFYSTVDEQVVDEEVPMSASAGGAEFQCQLPAQVGRVSSIGSGFAHKTRGGSGGGVQQDFVYWIEAGDARSPRYKVAVFAQPTLVVTQLRYDYPAYTGYPSRDVQHTGDIRAIEGTQVTLIAQANKPIKTAHVDFEADGRRDLLMSTTDQQATVTFPLTLREDRRTPRYQSYVLRYLTTAGNKNEQPPKYEIDVQPDYAPEIELLLPAEAILEVALNQEVEFELEARDPDFALSQVLLIGKLGEAELLQEELLAGNHTGRFSGKLRKTPQAMGLKVGDVLEYWGAATDNRRPEANIAYSAHRKLRVVGPWQGNQQGEKNQDGEGQQQPSEGGEPQAGEGTQEGQAGGGEQGNSGEGEAGSEGEGGSGQQEGEAGEQQQQQQGQGSGGDSAESDPAGSGDSQGNARGDSPTDDSDDSESSGSQPDETKSADDSAAGGPKEGEDGEQGKVSSEGDDDGSAFERMAEHFNEQAGKEGPPDQGESGEGEAAASENQSKSGGEGADPAPNDPASNDPASNDPAADDTTPANGQAGDPAGDGQAGDGDASEKAGEEGAGKAAAEPDGEAAGAAAEEKQPPKNAEKEGDAQQQAAESTDGTESPEQGSAEKGSPEQGDAGGGDDQGASPKPEGDEAGKSPQEKQGDSADAAEQNGSEAPSQGRDQGESETEGGPSGDRSGDGQEGAGQQAEQDGKGGAGENQPADDGAGQASETGDGETGEQPGGQEKAAGETGESSGDKAGEGSDQGEQAGDQSGGENAGGESKGEPGTEPDTAPAAEPDTESNAAPEQGQPGENSAEAANSQQPPRDQQAPPDESNRAAGEGQAGEGQAGQPSGTGGNPSAPPPGGEEQPGDDANLEYAREQTDLILDRLDDQLKRQDVDKDLLEKLGWSQDELRRFVDRWKQLKMQAADKNSSTEAQEELSDSLRSLGLERNRRTGFRSNVTKDQLRDLQDAFRGRVPLEFQEQVRSYVKGTTSSQENQ